jgi:hypothetical protein
VLTPEEIAAAEAAAAAAAQRPEYLLDKFSTESEQARAYAEAEKEMNRLRSAADEERAQFAAALEQMAAVQQQQQQQPPQPGFDPQANQLLSQLQYARENGDIASELAMTLGLQQQMLRDELKNFQTTLEPRLGEQAQADRTISFEIAQERVAKTYGDQWKEIAPDVNTWLREHPNWLPTANDPNQFEQVILEAAKYVANDKAAQQLAKMQADRDAKLASQTATGSGAAHPLVTDEKKAAWEEIKNAGGTSYADIVRGSG